jgi:hypothetical protein
LIRLTLKKHSSRHADFNWIPSKHQVDMFHGLVAIGVDQLEAAEATLRSDRSKDSKVHLYRICRLISGSLIDLVSSSKLNAKGRSALPQAG